MLSETHGALSLKTAMACTAIPVRPLKAHSLRTPGMVGALESADVGLEGLERKLLLLQGSIDGGSQTLAAQGLRTEGFTALGGGTASSVLALSC